MLWPTFEADTVRDHIFALGYTQHGGSGLSWSYSEVMEMDWLEVRRFVEILSETRSREAAAIKAAGSKKAK